ncbi:MAG: hypothetical protein JST19_07075 [Bacteroidetes bacterium]|nr:hypothetical protein [Bacteroidota bacterium]
MRYSAVFIITLLVPAVFANAQVQVRNEPRHHNVIENKYFRVLDVRIPPGDTTLQHIHLTPSVILFFSNTVTATQLKGQGWVKSTSVAGTALYRDFSKDTTIHRVSNWDTTPYHVTDIELLSVYDPGNTRKPLPFTLLFDTARVFAYRLTRIDKQLIRNRGPMIAGLVSGDDITLHDTTHNKTIDIKPGKETYIQPGISFYLSPTTNKEVNLVLFELK